MVHYNIDYIFIKKYASKITKSNIEDLVKRESELKGKILNAAKSNAAFMVKFGPKVILLFQMLKDSIDGIYTDIEEGALNSITFAILYFLNPFDLIPDSLPVIGYLDDILVLNIVYKNFQQDIKKYARWKGSDLIF